MNRTILTTGAALIVALAGQANAQQITNGDFELGNLTGWTVEPTFNGIGHHQDAIIVDIDGPGPLEPSYAARFSVGNITAMAGHQAGIEMFQILNLTEGTLYTASFNWAAVRTTATTNAEGGVFSLIVGNEILGTQAAGSTSSTTPKYGFIEQQFTVPSTGPYRVGVRITRPFTVSAAIQNELFQHVDNFILLGGSSGCYANCDGSTVEPVLNIDDFTCFINEFAAGQSLPPEQQVTHYANCDGSTVAPALNIDDFTCFINEFATGCP